jgi:hypothetical protein
MMNTTKVSSPNTTAPKTEKRPNESGTISVQAHVRIFDPTTQKTLVEARG